MAKNQLVIDFNKIKLTDEQRKSLHDAIHEVVSKEMKALAKTNKAKADTAVATIVSGKIKNNVAAAVATKTVKITGTFTGTKPELSTLTASFGDEEKSITGSGSISFSGIQSGDTIGVDVDSLGNSTITIDVDAKPAQMNFGPGNFSKIFFIK